MNILAALLGEGRPMLQGLAGDGRLAVRSLRAAPSVTLAAMLTLAIGIGATTAIFSVANGLMLRPLPVVEPERLVTISSPTALRFGFYGGGGWSYAMWDRLRPRAGAFDGAFAWSLDRVDLSEGGDTQPVTALFASGGFFDTLGVRATRGRTFTAADDVRGGGPDGGVVVISHDLWLRRFDGADTAIGARVSIEGTPVTIVGVAPPGFHGVDVGQPFALAMPFGTESLVRGRQSLVDNPRALLLTVMLRLNPGQTASQAGATLQAMQPLIIGERAPQLLKEPFLAVSAATGISDRSQLRQRYQRPLVVLAIVSGLVLVIACVNVANLLLARAAGRRRELGLRVAVGAPRWRLARQLLVEGVVLGTAGALAGVVVAAWAARAIVAQLPAGGAAPIDLPLDWRVLAFAAGVTTTAVALFTTAPAIYAAGVAPLEALQEAGRSDAGARTGLLARGLIVAQIAVSLVLVAAAALFARTLNRLVNVPLGFDPKGILVMTVNTAHAPADPSVRLQWFERIRDAAAALPGVTHAAGSVWTPVGTGGGVLADASGRRVNLSRQASFNLVMPGWFATYGTAIRAGRDLDGRDRAGAPHVALVNDTFRRLVLGAGPGVGETIDTAACAGCTVVGVVADTVYGRSLRDAPPPTVYVPLAQAVDLRPDAPFRLSLRTDRDLARVVPDLTGALERIEPRPSFTLSPLETDVDAAVAQEHLVARLAAVFGAIGLLLAAVGLYGVTSHAVARRRGEIGIRLALGETPSAVMRVMLASLGVLVLAGTAIGLLGALWLGRYVAPLLYGVESRDPVTLAAAAVTLGSVAAIAVWIPASRAARVDPALVLRERSP
jgi:predicted permease